MSSELTLGELTTLISAYLLLYPDKGSITYLDHGTWFQCHFYPHMPPQLIEEFNSRNIYVGSSPWKA